MIAPRDLPARTHLLRAPAPVAGVSADAAPALSLDGPRRQRRLAHGDAPTAFAIPRRPPAERAREFAGRELDVRRIGGDGATAPSSDLSSVR